MGEDMVGLCFTRGEEEDLEDLSRENLLRGEARALWRMVGEERVREEEALATRSRPCLGSREAREREWWREREERRGEGGLGGGGGEEG